MKPDADDLLRRTYELSKENNRMLHAMRRNAFIGGIIKLVIWAALIGIPIWLYLQYINPVLSSAVETINQVQNTGSQFGAQFSELGELLQKMGDIPGFSQFKPGE